jgi:RNA polymerase II-associated protein 1
VVHDGFPERGTPEDIRRRFFPSLPTGDPSLAWIESTPLPDPAAPTLRFDLHGTPIPPTLSATLPTHLGLHHHAEGARAGYTLDDIFLLARSTVPAQRVVMLGVLAGVVRRVAGMWRGISDMSDGLEELRGREEEIRKRAVSAGAEAMSERGSVGPRAVELLWETLVGWDEELMNVDGVELQEDPPKEVSYSRQAGEGTLKSDAISTLPLQFFLSQMAKMLGTADLPHLSLVQLLAVLQRLAMHSNTIADEIIDTPLLVANVLRVFILTPIPPSEHSPLPVPAAIHLLTTLASASRVSASKLLDPADTLLRFLTSPPSSSPYQTPLAEALLVQTFRLYTTFARYGLYAHIATTAAEPLARLSSYILSYGCHSRPLLTSYISLLGAWTTCASDPHQTTPPHEILWSQISGWGWIADVTTVARKLTPEPADFDTWAELWNTEAIWLEGARYNGMRGGASEREISLARLRLGFTGGTEKEVVLGAMSSLKRLLSEIPTGYDAGRDLAFYREILRSALVLSTVIRLWLACFAPDNNPLPEPPFQLPFSLLGTLAILTVTHPLLSEPAAIPHYIRPFLRPLVSFIVNYVWLSRRHPNTSSSLWVAQLSTAVMRCLPGDEDAARDMLDAIVDLIDERYLSEHGWGVSSEVWFRGGVHILKPFLAYGLAPTTDFEGENASRVQVAPLFPTPRSLMFTTTQRLPSRGFTFMFARDWTLLPLDHVLHSGTSTVWQHLPTEWDASETDVTRATLMLARAVREAVVANGTPTFAMNRAEVTFSCMKVFMLEHGQAQGAPSTNGENREEVFRDATVGELMEALLRPCRLDASSNGLSTSTSSDAQDNLELVGARFLGTGTPFFQFYTDFVTLYDGISFGHQLFAELLLPPLAQRYAADYRKLLYDDTAHALGTVRTPVERVIGGSVGTFLWPAEHAQEVVGAQLSLLVGRRARVPVEGFVRWMAVHHVAANIWPDLREDATLTDERGRKLLQSLVNQGEHGIVREVTLYWQRREGNVVLPPVCFDLEPARRRSRLDWVKLWANGYLLDYMERLLEIGRI